MTVNKFSNWDEVLAWVIAKQKEHEAAGGVDYGKLFLRLLNEATLAEKAKMTPEAIAAEEQSRRNHLFDPMTGRPRSPHKEPPP